MLKTISFAVLHFTVAFGVTFALTGDIMIGGLVAMIEPAINTVAYYFHEVAWNKLSVSQQQPVANDMVSQC